MIKRRTRPKMGVRVSDVVRCPSHLKWVRGHSCCLDGLSLTVAGVHVPHVCEGRIEAHHVREGANGGVGMKPDDSTTVPLCSKAHAAGHAQGWSTFQGVWRVDLTATAADLWRASPHGRKWREQHAQAEPAQRLRTP